MTIFQRLVLLLKVLVVLSLGASSAWANTAVQSQATGFVASKTLQLAASESEAGDKDQGGSEDDDDQQAPPDDDNSDDQGDSDT
ncbi:hypothetical protein [Pseudomonas sp. 18175]|uniref:hypothetical protein n=1 Tax=Pseudomonas sp. 18175 TaxID=3390056 RepID=UPI003D1F286C